MNQRLNLSDSEKNITVKYLYVKKFKWLNIIDTENFHGHPKEKSVYIAAYNSDTKGYRLFYQPDNAPQVGIVFHDLTRAAGEEGYESIMVEINRKNIVSLDIPEPELDKIIKWQSNGNKELNDAYGFKSTPQQRQIMIPSPQDMVNIVDNINRQQEITDFINDVQQLYDTDSLSFDSINSLVGELLQPDESDTSFEAVNLTLSRQHGSGHNVGKALNLLNIYLSDNPRVSLDREDLIKAIRHLIVELNRINYHGL